ncbi:MAG: hypothetical protein ABIA37_01495 [Candidatus Woesearchaeota archaeon]
MEAKPLKKVYEPKNVLLVLSKEDSHLAAIIGRELKNQGFDVHCEIDPIGAMSYYNTGHGVDALLAGAGHESLISYAEKNSRKGVFTVAVGDQGCPADLVLSSLNELVCFVEEKKLTESYCKNYDAQHFQEEGEEIIACLDRQRNKKLQLTS